MVPATTDPSRPIRVAEVLLVRFALIFVLGAVVIGFLAGVGIARILAALDEYEIVLTEEME